MPIVVPDISAGILQNIEHQKRSRAELGGAALDLSTGNMQLASDQVGSQGLDRAYSVMEQLAALMTKIIAASLIRETYLLVHETLRQFWKGPVDIRRTAGWDTAVPSEWPKRELMTVKPGMSPGERTKLIGALGVVLDRQLALAELGMDDVLVNIGGYYRALMDWSRANDLQNPEQYWIDPASDASKAALKKKQDGEKAAAEARSKLLDQALGLEQLRTSFDKYKQDTDLQFKYFDALLRGDVEEAKLIADALVSLGLERAATDEETTANQGSEEAT